jgi:hypothetical protein
MCTLKAVLSSECSAEGGHPHRAGVAHLVKQRAQVSIVDRPQRDN